MSQVQVKYEDGTRKTLLSEYEEYESKGKVMERSFMTKIMHSAAGDFLLYNCATSGNPTAAEKKALASWIVSQCPAAKPIVSKVVDLYNF